jgi:hypothetical protein
MWVEVRRVRWHFKGVNLGVGLKDLKRNFMIRFAIIICHH